MKDKNFTNVLVYVYQYTIIQTIQNSSDKLSYLACVIFKNNQAGSQKIKDPRRKHFENES